MPPRHDEQQPLLELAEAVRTACSEAARDGYRNAAISGLCSDGAQEAALGAIAMLDIEAVVRKFTSGL